MHIPWITLFITACTLILNADFSAVTLETYLFDTHAILNGELWRLISGHLIHSSPSHFALDLFAFALAAGYVERHSRTLLLGGILVSAVVLDLWLLSPFSEINRYCGLSGLLFAPVIIAVLHMRENMEGTLRNLPLVLCVIKLVLDLSKEQTLFVATAWSAYPEAHLIGALAGLAIYLIMGRQTPAPPKALAKKLLT